MLNLLHRSPSPLDLLTSRLFNEETFYPVFTKDLNKCLHEVIIESPFVTNRRLTQLLPILQKLKDRKVRVVINTRDPIEHDEEYHREDAHRAIATLQRIGVHVLYTAGHHRKIVLIDRQILYEGSLNVLSQNDSCEVMRRIESSQLAWQMARFVGIDKFLG
ncbi:MAG TPA: phospholipase D-like domain-containing protein [Candidatus Saccharimonadales bacterium]|jgi:phosphatidylserine/phosphatidylglycerophosphate/cardiolipin synthase-like enzyme|nr:phospholipase D-like domain-containing protein [Candidatus Saccharimonadales bacterium]